MAQFPSSPSVNDTHTLGNITWIWNGTAWDVTTAVSTIRAGENVSIAANGLITLSVSGGGGGGTASSWFLG